MARQDIKAGAAYVELMLRDKKFVNGLAGAQKKLKRFAKAAALASAAIASVGLAAAGVAVRSFTALGDMLDKMSQRIGVSVEALSELKHAAELSGTSAEQLEKGFAGLSRTFFDAKRGSGEATDALAALGISISDLEKLNPEGQMSLIADALAQISNESIRGAVAQRIFGRAGRELLPMLKNGSQGLEDMRKAARDAGITMSTESAASAARVNDLFSTLWSTIKRFVAAIGELVSPLLEVALPAVQAFATGTIKALSAAADVMRTVVSVATATVSQAFEAMFNFAAPVVGAMGVVISEVFKVISETVTGTWIIVRDATIAVWQSISGTVFSALDWIKQATIGTLSTISFAWKNWGLLLDTATTSAMLSVVRFANQTGHLFGEVIPTWLSWLYDNWRDIFTDIAEVTKTVASNIWNNLSALWDAVVDLFNGDGFTFEWSPLTEGFESAIKELPKIAKRQMGPLEQELQAELDALAVELVKTNQEHQKAFAKAAAGFTPDPLKLGGNGDGPVAAAGKSVADQMEEFLRAIPSAGSASREVVSSFSLASLQSQVGRGDGTTKAVDKQTALLEKWFNRFKRALDQNGGLGP